MQDYVRRSCQVPKPTLYSDFQVCWRIWLLYIIPYMSIFTKYAYLGISFPLSLSLISLQADLWAAVCCLVTRGQILSVCSWSLQQRPASHHRIKLQTTAFHFFCHSHFYPFQQIPEHLFLVTSWSLQAAGACSRPAPGQLLYTWTYALSLKLENIFIGLASGPQVVSMCSVAVLCTRPKPVESFGRWPSDPMFLSTHNLSKISKLRKM